MSVFRLKCHCQFRLTCVRCIMCLHLFLGLTNVIFLKGNSSVQRSFPRNVSVLKQGYFASEHRPSGRHFCSENQKMMPELKGINILFVLNTSQLRYQKAILRLSNFETKHPFSKLLFQMFHTFWGAVIVTDVFVLTDLQDRPLW